MVLFCAETRETLAIIVLLWQFCLNSVTVKSKHAFEVRATCTSIIVLVVMISAIRVQIKR